jgi:hypothetical protein
MSNRRNFLLLMGGTASSIVVSNIGKGVFNPAYAQKNVCTIDNKTTESVLNTGLKVLENVGKSIVNLAGKLISSESGVKVASLSANNLLSQVPSVSGPEIARLSAKIEESVDASTEFWGNAENVELFIRGLMMRSKHRSKI